MTGSEWWAAAPSDLASKEYARHVLDAVDDGLLYWQWRDLQVGPLTVRCMTQPLAVGTAEDHVHLYGMTAALMDRIVEEHNQRGLVFTYRDRRGAPHAGPREIMPLTSLLLDAMAADPRAVLVGPFVQRQPPAKNRERHAARHSDALRAAQVQRALNAGAVDNQAEWIHGHIWPECKTYVLNPRHRPGYAWKYGWHVRSGWSPSATELACGDCHGIPRVIQPEQRAHSYSAFQDYSMGALFVSAHGVMSHPAKHGRTRVERVDLRQLLADPERCHLVTVHGAQDWHTLRGPA